MDKYILMILLFPALFCEAKAQTFSFKQCMDLTRGDSALNSKYLLSKGFNLSEVNRSANGYNCSYRSSGDNSHVIMHYTIKNKDSVTSISFPLTGESDYQSLVAELSQLGLSRRKGINGTQTPDFGEDQYRYKNWFIAFFSRNTKKGAVKYVSVTRLVLTREHQRSQKF
jgi:hypothetical protein